MRSVRRHPLFHTPAVVALLKRAVRRASVELLENRQLLSAVVVNTAVDQTDAPGGPTVSLRDALAIASAASSPTTITFDPTVFATAQTITLQGSGYLSLNSSQGVTITGPAVGVTIDANQQSNVLVDNSTGGNVNISNMTLTNGAADEGGGIEHTGSDTLTLTNLKITGNTAYYDGGGIFNTAALVIDGCSITGNTVTNVTGSDGAGGGIDNTGGTLTVMNSTISGNTSQSVNAIGGGGITNRNGGSATLLDSTISNNSNYANQPGGSLVNAPGGGVLSTGTLTVTNCTIAGNTGSLGGGMYITGGVTLSDSTISGNTGTDGGGLCVSTNATIQNSVISGNTYLSGGGSPDVATAPSDSVISNGNNLVGKTDGSSGWTGSDITGTIASPVNAQLAALANNGGPTQTMLPQTGSPLIDAGSNALIPSGITTDQRGLPRIFNTTVDIGSVETQPVIILTAPLNQSAIVGQSQSFSLGSFSQIGATAPFAVNVNWGDGSMVAAFSANSPGTIAAQSHTYAAAGSRTVTVTVTDASGLVTASDTFTVNVGVGSITVTGPSNQTAFVGVSQSFTLGSFSEANATAPFTVDVNWGDGSTNTTFTTSSAGTIAPHTHTYQTATTDTATVTVTDASGTVTDNATFNVTVSLGTITVTPPASQTAATGRSKSFNLGSFTAANTSGPYTVAVNWGDGTALTTFAASSTGTITAQSHTFAATSTDTITVTVTDVTGLVTNNANFTVNAILASVNTTAPADQTALINVSKSFALGTFTAINTTAPYTVQISWGDGSADTIFTQQAAGTITPKSHTYTVLGTDTVTVSVSDAASGVSDNDTFVVTVSTGITPSSTALAITNTAFQFGTSQTLTATVSPSTATGTVLFMEGSIVLGTVNVGAGGIATLATSSFTTGTSTVSATYSGDATYTASVSPEIDITVTPPPNTTTLALQSSSTSITADESVTLTATVSPASVAGTEPTGTVSFFDGTSLLGTAPMNPGGTATLTTTTPLPTGTDALTASYSGDINFSTSNAAAVSVHVVATQSAMSVMLSNPSKTIAQEVTLSATVGPATTTPTTLATLFPTGTITFLDNGTTIGTASVGPDGIASLTTNAPKVQGIDLITATYGGDKSFLSTSSTAADLYVTAHALVPVVTKVSLPKSAIGGVRIRGSVNATLTNELTSTETGPEKGIFSVRLYASPTSTLDLSTDPLVASMKRNAKIAEGKTVRVSVPITSYPATLATGAYHLLLETTDAAGNTEIIDTGATAHIIAPVILLSASFESVPKNVVTKGAMLSITTTGNVNDVSSFTVVLDIATDAAGHTLLATDIGKLNPAKFTLRPGKITKVRVTGWQSLLTGLPKASYYFSLTVIDANGNRAFAVNPATIST